MNSKLDNLGQLRHLQKGLTALDKASDDMIKSLQRDERESQANRHYNWWFYEALCAKTGKNPITEHNLDTRDLDVWTPLQIKSLFEM
jgi:hypothetical protein